MTSADFDLTDNGVPQTISSLNVPGGAHVIVVLDTSASVAGEALTQLTDAVTALLGRLSDDDRGQ